MSRFTVSLMVAMGTMTTLWGMVACGPTAGGGSGGATTTTTRPTGGAGTGGTGTAQDAGTPPAAECPAEIEQPCMRYHIELVGDPNTHLDVRAKYIAAFGDACYVAETGTFDCFYQKWQDACADAAKIGAVSGNAPYDQGYTCQPDGNGNYTLQIGSDVANVTYINYQPAPRQTPDTDIGGMPTQVNGPYRNLTDPADVAPGNPFKSNSGMVDADGGALTQQAYILQVNRNANDGGVRSDLATYSWSCPDGNGGYMKCTEPEFLEDSFDPIGTKPNVHHVVPMKDKRCCPWGTNSYKNAAVISQKLNNFLSNENPTVEEVTQLNPPTPAYTP